MSTILSIDTSTEACSVGLLINNEVTHDFVLSQRDHTKLILPMVDRLLQQSDCSLSAIDAIAFSKGPGSFTGVRIGIGIAQGLAFGIDRPLIGVSTLATLAQGVYRQHQATKVISTIDARMGEVYLGAYHCVGNGDCQLMLDECVIKPELVADYLSSIMLDKPNTYYAGTGWQTYPNMLDNLQDGQLQLPHGQDMVMIAEKKYQQGEITLVENVEATYLRNEVTWKKLPGRK